MNGLSTNRGDAGAAVSVVRAGVDDHDTLSALHGLCFASAWSTREFADLLVQSNALAFLARNTDPTGAHCGFIVLRQAADEAEIITLGVVPSARRQGIATALLAGAVAALKTDGIAFLFLEVAEDNTAALGLYRAHGFCDVGRRDGYYTSAAGTPGAAVVMRRAIGSGD